MNVIKNVLLAVPRAFRWAWRKVTPEGARKVAYLSVVLLVCLQGYNVKLGREASATNRQTLTVIKEQTSPEAQQRQAELIDLIIERVDCRNQASLQRTILVLEERGVLRPGEVKAITDACERLAALDPEVNAGN